MCPWTAPCAKVDFVVEPGGLRSARRVIFKVEEDGGGAADVGIAAIGVS